VVPFPSFPHEWSAGMLAAAGHLTLDLAERLLAHGLGLKDATPYNVLFRGASPVFIDVLSVERRNPLDATWLPYAQFARTFVLPLLAARDYHLGLGQTFTLRRDGMEPEDLYALAGPLRRLRPPYLTLVTLPVLLGRGREDARTYAPRLSDAPEKARFVLTRVLRHLRRSLRRSTPDPRRTSAWSDYMATKSYDDVAFTSKERFVRAALARARPTTVLDVGCNTGHFALLAAELGARVVAVDRDPVVVDVLHRVVVERRANVLPLVVDISRPTPALGWRNGEAPAFLERARGGFDAVLLLALVHHLMVTERIPPEEIADLAAELTRGIAIVEYIGAEDAMFRRLLRGRDALFAADTQPRFEAAFRRRFDFVESETLPGTQRRLYLMQKRQSVT
jgi:SAM-dependent methyltransferase